jgi:electron transport complex protein RnfG
MAEAKKTNDVAEILKLGFVLMLFATVACVGLAFVYNGTKDTIARQGEENLKLALQGLFPAADFVKIDSGLESGNASVRFTDSYSASSGGKTIGAAITAVSGGFNDDIAVLVGIGSDGKIAGIKILTNTDTPGLGANASSDKYFVDKSAGITFFGQFAGKGVASNLKVAKDGGAIQAITAATISSRAVALIVEEAAKAGSAWLSATSVAADVATNVDADAAAAYAVVPAVEGGSE